MAVTRHILTFNLLASLVGSLGALCLVVVSWAAFLDRHEHQRMDIVRVFLGTFLSIAAVVEVWFCATGIVDTWALFLLLVADVWGGMDALIRFPAAHGIASAFTVKQIALSFLKVGALLCGCFGIRAHICQITALLLLDVIGLPLLYIMAQPMDPSFQVVKREEDIDLLVRAWRLAIRPKERRRCLAQIRARCRCGFLVAAERFTLARRAIVAISPACGVALQRKGKRSV
eukprot:TRINITY_DN17529_c0_g1_i2.p1 TRINITY_DN17529_c0_g1~~TRINITY_DN17529_c0_g1_i2.p1  ORF type:complete len:230 (+),score=22.98 TRINITY_DN17529_c0_g1_i2:63-752(+)